MLKIISGELAAENDLLKAKKLHELIEQDVNYPNLTK